MTILSTPDSYSSLHDDLIYTVFDSHVSNPSTYTNYKYIADVYVGAVLVARIKKVQDPTTGVGVFNIGLVVRNYISTSFNPGSGLVAQRLGLGSFFINVQVKFGEEYNLTDYLNVVSDISRPYFNHYNGRMLGVNTNLTSKANKFASENPLYGQVLLSSGKYFVPYFPTSGTAVSVTVTPSGGGSSFFTSFSPAINELQLLNLSPGALNALHPGAITSTTTSYTVLVGTQTYIITVVCEPMYETFMIHFFNKYGGFESKLFSKVSRKTLGITKKEFGKLPYTVDSSGVVSYYNSGGVYNETNSVYASTYQEKLTLNSDILTDQEYTWLGDLILSPMVYIEDGAYLIPCMIKQTNYEFKKIVNDDLTNLEISIEYGQTFNTQFR